MSRYGVNFLASCPNDTGHPSPAPALGALRQRRAPTATPTHCSAILVGAQTTARPSSRLNLMLTMNVQADLAPAAARRSGQASLARARAFEFRRTASVQLGQPRWAQALDQL
jgi:hypothetical protein